MRNNLHLISIAQFLHDLLHIHLSQSYLYVRGCAELRDNILHFIRFKPIRAKRYIDVVQLLITDI